MNTFRSAAGIPQNARTTSWWLADTDEARLAGIVEVLAKIRESQSWRVDAHQYHAELYYGGTVAAGLRPGERVGYEYTPTQMPFNVVRRSIDSMTARIARTRPQPIVQATAGSWRDMKRAKKATQLLEGEFYRQRFWPDVWPSWIRDACTFGSGLIAVCRYGKTIVTDRVLPTEVFVDEWDARYGNPRNLYRIREMDRGVVGALFCVDDDGKVDQEKLGIVNSAGRIEPMNAAEDVSNATVDMVTTVECWHLCDNIAAHSPTATDEEKAKHAKRCTGKRSFAVSSGVLETTPWERPYFPIIKLDHTPPLVGFWGQGMAEQLEGTQFEINLVEERLQEAFKLVPGLWIFNPGNTVLESHFVNGLGKIVPTGMGQQPQIVNPQPVDEQFFQRQANLVQSAAPETGQTEQGMQGAKQPGITAAVAIRELIEQESARHVVLARSAEEGVLEYGRHIFDCVKEIAAEYGDHAASVPMNDGILPLKWSECDVETYTLRVFSSSVLPQSRPARVQTLNEWFDRQIIDRETYLRQLEATDLQAETDLETAGRVLLDEVLETMLFTDSPEDEEAYIPPSQFIDPQYAIRRTQQKILWAKLRKAPHENVELLERHIVDYEALAMKAAPPPAPQPQGAPGMVLPGLPQPPMGPPAGPVSGPLAGPQGPLAPEAIPMAS